MFTDNGIRDKSISPHIPMIWDVLIQYTNNEGCILWFLKSQISRHPTIYQSKRKELI